MREPFYFLFVSSITLNVNELFRLITANTKKKKTEIQTNQILRPRRKRRLRPLAAAINNTGGGNIPKWQKLS